MIKNVKSLFGLLGDLGNHLSQNIAIDFWFTFFKEKTCCIEILMQGICMLFYNFYLWKNKPSNDDHVHDHKFETIFGSLLSLTHVSIFIRHVIVTFYMFFLFASLLIIIDKSSSY